MKIAILASLLALALSLNFTEAKGWSHHEEWAGDRYDCLAVNLWSGRGYVDCAGGPTAYRLPVYPVALGIGLRLFGGEPGARLFQSIVASQIVFLTVALTARLVDWRGQLVAGVVMLSSGSLYYFASMLMTETLFTWLTLLMMVGIVRWR